MTLQDTIMDYVAKRDNVSFAELERDLTGVRGGMSMVCPGNPNLVLWSGLSADAIDAINGLRSADRIYLCPVSVWAYVVDGRVIDLPIANNPSRKYKNPRWLPVVIKIDQEFFT